MIFVSLSLLSGFVSFLFVCHGRIIDDCFVVFVVDNVVFVDYIVFVVFNVAIFYYHHQCYTYFYSYYYKSQTISNSFHLITYTIGRVWSLTIHNNVLTNLMTITSHTPHTVIFIYIFYYYHPNSSYYYCYSILTTDIIVFVGVIKHTDYDSDCIVITCANFVIRIFYISLVVIIIQIYSCYCYCCCWWIDNDDGIVVMLSWR